MAHLLPSYLHTLRKRRGLSQPDLASLLGVTGSALSRFENRSRRPTAKLLIGAEVIFGQVPKDVFPAFYRNIERSIVERARARRANLESQPGAAVSEKYRLLTEIIDRAGQTSLNL